MNDIDYITEQLDFMINAILFFWSHGIFDEGLAREALEITEQVDRIMEKLH